MKTKIAVGLNGFVYKELSKPKKMNVDLDLIDFARKINLKRLNEGKNTFLNRAFKLE